MRRDYYDKNDYNGKNLGWAVLKLYRKRNKGAEEGETCTLCKTPVNTGATVCTGCQAERIMKPKGFFGVIFGIILLFASLSFFYTIFALFMGKGSSVLPQAIISFALMIIIPRVSPVHHVYEKHI
ncbi:MAG: hypothetical protein JW982_01785 [Spirochaetes bacterium]|nr:hypothetical protein [Spirochaetota bacterium]